MWLSEEMSGPGISFFEASFFQVELKKSEEYSICTGQSSVYLTLSVAYSEVTDGMGSKSPGRNQMHLKYKAVRGTRVQSF